jgi:preprotein translocase subunit SecY
MWEKFRAIFTIPELRQKIFFTLILLAVFRVGYQIPLPIIDQKKLAEQLYNKQAGAFANLMQNVSTLSAADLRRITIFGLGIMPYISASIILQLLGSVYKPLEELRKEGETGRKKINEYTRYLTVLMCVVQGGIYLSQMVRANPDNPALSNVAPNFQGPGGGLDMMWYIASLFIMTAGTMFVMWLGEQIDEFGIGNGISLLIMAGILAQMPNALIDLFGDIQKSGWRLGGGTQMGVEHLFILIALFVVVVAGVVFMQLGQRQIPTQSAKHVRGRRVYGGNRQYLPLRLNQSGVMPIIFASSLLMLPSLILSGIVGMMGSFKPGSSGEWWANQLANLAGVFTRGNSLTYNLCYIALIYFFSYFWMAITFNPKEISENLKDFGTFIPGYRPGRRTAEYLEKVMIRITYVGSAFLALVAIVPTVISASMGVKPNIASFYGGTGLLIAVSVAFDLIQKIDSHLVMRDYRGLLEQ